MERQSFLLLFAMPLLLASCGGSSSSASSSSASSSKAYEKSTTYVYNAEHDNRKIFTVEIKPTGLEAGKKAPLIIYSHGGGGTATNFEALEKVLAKSNIAGLSFEFCGGNNDNPHYSDGDDIYPAHYSSRISDLEAIHAYAKTLDYVDADQIYWLGESYGGITIMEGAGDHNDDVKGLFIVSSGYQEDIVGVSSYKGVDENHNPADPYERIKEYENDVLLICGDQDETGAHDNSELTLKIYNEREKGNASMYTVVGGKHGYSTFPSDEKTIVQQKLISFIEEH